eukprot:COSAG01_NODE_56897_length_315_cov_1.712963_1_plen_61_part_01
MGVHIQTTAVIYLFILGPCGQVVQDILLLLLLLLPRSRAGRIIPRLGTCAVGAECQALRVR